MQSWWEFFNEKKDIKKKIKINFFFLIVVKQKQTDRD